MFDYQDLLRRYMLHVASVEGSCFTNMLNATCSGVKFTLEEMDELFRIEREEVDGKVP